MIIFKGKTHVVVALGICFYVFGFNIYNMVAIIVGSLFPDIDTPYSILGRYNIFSCVMKHRGITHTLLGMLMFSWLVHMMFGNFVWGFIFGYTIHLFMDAVTPMGIMWLYPYKRKYYSIWKRKNPRKLRV